MNHKIFSLSIAAATLAFVIGCTTMDPHPVRYDQVLVYDTPYDYTYLRTLEAVNTFSDWVLEETDKEKGLIVLRNTQYGHLFDRDKVSARFVVTRVSQSQTSVALEPDSQQIQQGKKLLDQIDAMIKATMATRRKKETAPAPASSAV